MFTTATNHLDRLQSAMLEMQPTTRSKVAAEYIRCREALGKSENWAAIAALTLYSNITSI
jgi:hypothetical protein